MHCEICKSLKTDDKSELLTFSARAYTQVISILKISGSRLKDKTDGSSFPVAVCVKCLQGF